MTDGYDCYHNALAERVNGLLKGVLQQENALLSPVLRFGYPCESSFKVLMFSITTIDNFSEKTCLLAY